VIVEKLKQLKKYVVLVCAFTLPFICSYACYHLGHDSGYNKSEANLQECAVEVSKGCPNVTSYAIMLEEENAKLNKLCRASQKSTD
jgi:hypothetical protein